jgi:hypothetical protein
MSEDEPILNPQDKPLELGDKLEDFPAKFSALNTRVTKGAIATQTLSNWAVNEVTAIKTILDNHSFQYSGLKLLCFLLAGYNFILISIIAWKLS